MQMDKMSNQMSKRLATVAVAVVAACASLAATAQQVSDQWQYRASIYGWLPDIGGKTTFPAGTGSSISVDASQIISNLKFTFMGTFEAQKGPWGVFTDVIYLDVGGSKSETRDIIVDGHPLPVGITADATLDLKSLIWTLAGSYRVVTDPGVTMDVIAGARLIDIKQTLGWQFSADLGDGTHPARSGSSEAKGNKTDGIVGVKGRLIFGADREWYVPYYLDIGTGQTDLTWQAVAGVGYVFKWGEMFAVWRYLDYNFKSDAKIEDVNFSGPAIGVAFRW
jgi:hypothetical protein